MDASTLATRIPAADARAKRAVVAALAGVCALGSVAPARQLAPAPASTVPTPAAITAAPPTDESTLPPAELIRQLDHPSFAQRERAAAALLLLPHIGLPEIEQHAARENLTPEQQARLEPIALEMMARTPRAGMGVQFIRDNPELRGVELGRTIDGFDAARVLQPGDVIRSIAGISVATISDARYAILSHDPGDEMSVELMRQGEPLSVTVRAGSYEDLNNGRATISPDELRLAWQYRIARLRSAQPAQPPAVGANITPYDWRLMNEAVSRMIDEQILEATARHADMQRENPSFRLATGRIEADQPAGITAGGSDRAAGLEASALFLTANDALTAAPQILDLQRKIDNYVSQIRRNERRIVDPNTLPAERMMLQRRNADYISMISRLREEQRRLQREVQP